MRQRSTLRASYQIASSLLGPALHLLLLRRVARGKEDRVRVAERRGIASLVRPAGPLVWVHVASVGESLSVLPLVERLLASDPKLHVLVTSATLTSARLLGKRLPDRAFHQFSPLDRPEWVRRFVQNWRPDLAIFVESELWPNLITHTRQSGCRCVLVNGRISGRSYSRWQKSPGMIRSLLSDFSVCLVQDAVQVARFKALGADDVRAVGNLKMIDGRKRGDSVLINADIIDRAGRPTWLAASTHAGEEEVVLDLHNHLVRRVPGLLTMIALRHPERREDVLALLKTRGLRFVTRSSGAAIEEDHEVFLIDSIGELPDFYAAADAALVCGSLVPGIGGHNPVEALHRGTATLMGAYVANFETLTAELLTCGAIGQVADADAAKAALLALLTDSTERAALAAGAEAFLALHAQVLEGTWQAIQPLLPISKNDVAKDNVVPLRA